MINLTSGLPGAGKTLWTIAHVEALRKKDNRDVYYHGIKELTLPWKPLDDPKKWYECPPGSIIVIDEAQHHFPTRGVSQAVPKHVAEAATHRHHGFDLFLITQHPGKLDSALRKDIELHRHLMRAFGTHRATVHQWTGIRENCDKSRKDSLSSGWSYPKDVFTWYKSAEVHTVKRRVPLKLYFALLLPVIAIGGFAWIFRDRSAPKPEPDQAQPRLMAYAPGQAGMATSQAGQRQAPKTPQEYALERVPRLEGLAHTAPAYDALTVPRHVPRPAACVQSASQGCRCWTQQATPYNTTQAICRQIVATGMFIDFDDQALQREQQEQRRQAQQPQGHVSTLLVSGDNTGPQRAE